jgi:hypothetical protein
VGQLVRQLVRPVRVERKAGPSATPDPVPARRQLRGLRRLRGRILHPQRDCALRTIERRPARDGSPTLTTASHRPAGYELAIPLATSRLRALAADGRCRAAPSAGPPRPCVGSRTILHGPASALLAATRAMSALPPAPAEAGMRAGNRSSGGAAGSPAGCCAL